MRSIKYDKYASSVFLSHMGTTFKKLPSKPSSETILVIAMMPVFIMPPGYPEGAGVVRS